MTTRQRGRSCVGWWVARVVALAGAAGVLASCAVYRAVAPVIAGTIGRATAAPIVVPAYRVGPGGWRPSGPLAAGAARVDITPPVGYATGGHGPAGAIARAYWTRLYARAFFFADTAGHPLVLVSCDLFAMPGGLAARVSRAVAARWAGMGLAIPPEAIIVAATHTHHGPGNFLTWSVANEYGSKVSGFDPALFAFLERRITSAVDSAIARGVRGGPATLTLRSGRLPDTLLLNRAPETFLANWNARALLERLNPDDTLPAPCTATVQQGEAIATGWGLAGCPRRRARDPVATMLAVDRGGRRVATLVFLAVHPTVLDHAAPLFSSDFTGQEVSTLEQRPRVGDGGADSVVVGFFNGAEGDVVARRGARDMRDVRQAAVALGDVLDRIAAEPGRTMDAPTVETRRTVIVPGVPFDTAVGSPRLPKTATIGTAMLGGAEDDRTLLYALGWREGRTGVPHRDQGLKLPGLDSDLLPVRPTALLAPAKDFPAELPVTLARLGNLTLAAVPVEMTTAEGVALREALGDSGSRHATARGGALEIVGLANEYASYTTTADEYELQDYAGASTLWGPNEGDALRIALQCLAFDTAADRAARGREPCGTRIRPDAHAIPERVYHPGHEPDRSRWADPFGASWVGALLPAPDDGFARVLRDASGTPARTLPWCEWTETVRTTGEFDATARRHVEVLEQTVDGRWVVRTTPWGTRDDDGGTNTLTVLRQGRSRDAPLDDVHHWAAIWLAPALESVRPAGTYKFRVSFASGPEATTVVESPPFTVDARVTRRDATRKACR